MGICIFEVKIFQQPKIWGRGQLPLCLAATTPLVKLKIVYSSEGANLSQNYGASPAMWDHTVLPATRHK